MVGDCLFCKIVAGEIPATVVARASGMVAFEDIAPKADTHVLVVPERHLESLREVDELDAHEAQKMLNFVASTAHGLGLEDYRVIVNVGPGGGQTVFHLH
ncbi:MAG: HIT domain-containing protein, partial [Gaiellaceae bacterium]